MSDSKSARETAEELPKGDAAAGEANRQTLGGLLPSASNRADTAEPPAELGPCRFKGVDQLGCHGSVYDAELARLRAESAEKGRAWAEATVALKHLADAAEGWYRAQVKTAFHPTAANEAAEGPWQAKVEDAIKQASRALAEKPKE